MIDSSIIYSLSSGIFKLKNIKYNRIGISHEFTTEQLITQKKLLTQVKIK